jgi:A/G-specific adenine glycosylase
LKKTRKKSAGPSSVPCDLVARAAGDAAFTRNLADWFAREARDLPWRKTVRGGRDAWKSLVSEVMLQQTQVSRVLERFGPFMERFPTPLSMVQAGEQAVLALWSGMGYYRRARMLFAAAQQIVERFGGVVPADAADLRSLPGIGRYTAGAVSSIVFGKPEPIVDGNVARVLLRVEGREVSAAEGADWCWERAGQLARAAGDRVAGFNEGLMELGAVVCTPRSPRCEACPVTKVCEARRIGKQEEIPAPKKQAKRSILRCEVVVVRDPRGLLLVERRAGTGMWAGLWQAPTLERPHAECGMAVREILSELGLEGVRITTGSAFAFVHQTTHREVRFSAIGGALGAGGAERALKVPANHTAVERRWVRERDLSLLGLSNAQKRILTREPDLFG